MRTVLRGDSTEEIPKLVASVRELVGDNLPQHVQGHNLHIGV